MWFYVQRVLIPYEKADAAAHERPRGNLSDLYPRWLGARELLLHHRNPYGNDVTAEIQKGYYGRELDPARPGDPKDRQGFAYPVYVVFLLAPLIGLPFHGVQVFFYWLLVGLTAASVWLWLRALRWRLPLMAVAACIAFTLGSFPAVQGIKLQQLSLLVAALLAASVACVASGFLFLGGALLALATIKPQLAWPLVAWLLLWAVSDWRARRKFVLGFVTGMALLLAGAEIILPGWWRMFAEAIGRYHEYTQNQPVLEVVLNQVLGSAAGGTMGRVGGQILAVMAVLACAPVLWKLRRERTDAPGFSAATALVLALTVLVIPMYAPYNQVLLLPAILLLVRERAAFRVAVPRPPFGLRRGRASCGMAVGREPWPDGDLLAGLADVGARWLEVAVLCNICIAGVGVRADFLLRPRRTDRMRDPVNDPRHDAEEKPPGNRAASIPVGVLAVPTF